MLETIIQRIKEGELIQIISNNPLQTYQLIVEDLDIEHIYISLQDTRNIRYVYYSLGKALSVGDRHRQLVEETCEHDSSLVIAIRESNRIDPVVIFLTDVEDLDNGELDEFFRFIKYLQDEKQWQQWPEAYTFIILTREDIYRYPFGMLYDSCTFVLGENDD